MSQTQECAAFRLATSEVCDYFHRLGGAGRYPGFESWHCFALVAIIQKGISCDELNGAGIYINRQLWEGCDGLYQKIEQRMTAQDGKKMECFLKRTSDYMEHRVRRYGTYEEYRGWITFRWYLDHRDRGCIWRQ